MGMIEVIDPGMLSSIQDGGRKGYRQVGVPMSGAFDSVALSIGNRMLGNKDTAAAIEMTMTGGEYRFTTPAVVCLVGAYADDASVNDGHQQHQLVHQQPVVIPTGSRIRVPRFQRGARGYLCVRGGIRSSLVLGSRSALVSLPGAGLGTQLFQGDKIAFDDSTDVEDNRKLSSCTRMPMVVSDKLHQLRIVPGAHAELFAKSQREELCEQTFCVSDQSNRAGVRLSGGVIAGNLPEGIASEGTLAGYVQVPPSGEPIILGVDGPSTGGYPVIACVIKADISRLAQIPIREQIQFRWVNRAEAIEAYIEQQAMIQTVKFCHPVQLPYGNGNV